MAERRKLYWNTTSKMLEYLKVKMNNSKIQSENLKCKISINDYRYRLTQKSTLICQKSTPRSSLVKIKDFCVLLKNTETTLVLYIMQGSELATLIPNIMWICNIKRYKSLLSFLKDYVWVSHDLYLKINLKVILSFFPHQMKTIFFL